MALQKKAPPRMKDPEIARAFQRVYDDLNELINAVNQGSTTREKSVTKGKAGDLRVVKHGSGSYYLEAKTDEGWIKSDGASASGFSFREKENL